MMQAEHIEGNRWRVIDGDVEHDVFVPAGLDDEAGAAAAIAALQPPAPEVVAAWALEAAKDRLKARRDRAIAAGVTVEIGEVPVTFATHEKGLNRIAAAALEAMTDPAPVVKWKENGAYVPLTATDIIAVHKAARAHVQACIDREAELLDDIAAADDPASVDISEGWPG